MIFLTDLTSYINIAVKSKTSLWLQSACPNHHHTSTDGKKMSSSKSPPTNTARGEGRKIAVSHPQSQNSYNYDTISLHKSSPLSVGLGYTLPISQNDITTNTISSMHRGYSSTAATDSSGNQMRCSYPPPQIQVQGPPSLGISNQAAISRNSVISNIQKVDTNNDYLRQVIVDKTRESQQLEMKRQAIMNKIMEHAKQSQQTIQGRVSNESSRSVIDLTSDNDDNDVKESRIEDDVKLKPGVLKSDDDDLKLKYKESDVNETTIGLHSHSGKTNMRYYHGGVKLPPIEKCISNKDPTEIDNFGFVEISNMIPKCLLDKIYNEAKKKVSTLTRRKSTHVPKKKKKIPTEFKIGQRVEAKYQGTYDEWYQGTIVGGGNGYYDIDYDDGDTDRELHSSYIRALVVKDEVTNVKAETPPFAIKSRSKAKSKGQLPCPDLGAGWTMDIIPRKPPSKTVDKYWYCPNGMRFRSSISVERYLLANQNEDSSADHDVIEKKEAPVKVLPEGKWQCHKCAKVNPPTRSRCEEKGCFAWKRGVLKTLRPSSSLSSKRASAKRSAPDMEEEDEVIAEEISNALQLDVSVELSQQINAAVQRCESTSKTMLSVFGKKGLGCTESNYSGFILESAKIVVTEPGSPPQCPHADDHMTTSLFGIIHLLDGQESTCVSKYDSSKDYPTGISIECNSCKKMRQLKDCDFRRGVHLTNEQWHCGQCDKQQPQANSYDLSCFGELLNNNPVQLCGAYAGNPTCNIGDGLLALPTLIHRGPGNHISATRSRFVLFFSLRPMYKNVDSDKAELYKYNPSTQIHASCVMYNHYKMVKDLYDGSGSGIEQFDSAVTGSEVADLQSKNDNLCNENNKLKEEIRKLKERFA